MNILDLSRSLSVEVDKFHASWCSCRLLIVRVKTGQEVVGLCCNSIGLISRLCLIGSMIFFIETFERGEESSGNAVLLVKINSSLSSSISNMVTMGKVFSNNTTPWLLLLCNLIAIAFGVAREMAPVVFGRACGAYYLNVGLSKLSVVEEKSRLRSSLLLKGDRGILSLSC